MIELFKLRMDSYWLIVNFYLFIYFCSSARKKNVLKVIIMIFLIILMI